MPEYLTMSQKELDRLSILNKVRDGQITQVKAAELLGISDRQIRNLIEGLNIDGPQGIVSKKRGKPSNRQIDSETRERILKLIQERYVDFAPTLATEKLEEYHQIRISHETLRQWMIQEHLWIPHVKKRKLHPTRQRKASFGEMIQADGSHHDWFENGIPSVLIVFIDDATSQITAARFEERETLEGYFQTLKQHLEKFGRPISMYTDRFSVFDSGMGKDNLTQFQRALKSLSIDWIGANSPQAKGRVERCNRTLQDRLVKELRLREIKSIEEANECLEELIEKHNTKFSKEPKKKVDLHRPLEDGLDISRTLSKYEERTLTKDLLFQFNNKHYKIIEEKKSVFPGQKLEIRTSSDGNIRVFNGNQELIIRRLDQDYENNKKVIYLNDIWPIKQSKSPKAHHPWRNSSCCSKVKREYV